MNIGIFFKHERSGGGIYQYFLTIMDCIKRFNTEDLFVLFYRYEPDLTSEWNGAGIRTIRLKEGEEPPSVLNSEGASERKYAVNWEGKEIFFKTRSFTEELKEACRYHKIDLMVYSNAERESFETGIPYVTAALDWTHRTHPQFKEFTADGVYEQREYVLANGMKSALFVLADSETAKKEITEYYGIEPQKIVVLPFVPPPCLSSGISQSAVGEVKRKYQLPDKFIFYPAQFWPHKNHEGIIRALHLIKKDAGEEVEAVFVGSAQSKWTNLEKMMELANKLGVKKQVMYLGYVDQEDMYALYRLATALVMPTFPGPTNIPVLEAFATGCPVVTTDIQALREQVGDAGILVNPESPEKIASAIHRVWEDVQFRNMLAEKGRARLEKWGLPDFCRRLNTIMGRAKEVLSKKENALC